MFSRQTAIRKVDGRTREAHLIKRTIGELVDQLGGPDRVSAAQRILIHATAVMVFRLRAALDRYTTGKGDVESLDRHVATLTNSIRLNLLALGLEQAKEAAPSLERYLEAKKAA